MNDVINDSGKELNAQFKVLEIDEQLGFILESRGGKKRNKDYNEALEIILKRLQQENIDTVKIKIVSASLLKNVSNPSLRTIKINGKTEIVLKGIDTIELRKKIGSEAAKLKIDKTKKGGNPTKRIQIVSDFLSEKEWEKIAIGESLNSSEFNDNEIFSFQAFEEKVNGYLKKRIRDVPQGNFNPKKKNNASQYIYERDPKIKAWILQNASGKCEYCNIISPFIALNGLPYLEVHHLKPLSNGGSDTVENTIALCPNCHREFHYGINKEEILAKAYEQIERLKKED